MILSSKVFKKYDIRGNADNDFSDADTVNLGRAIGTFIQQNADEQVIYVGRDNRLSSTRLRDNLIEGLKNTGLHVHDLGTISTPNLYWYAVRNNAGGIMITGSHLDPEFNGFKMCIGSRALYGDDVQDIQSIFRDSSFLTGNGQVTEITDSIQSYLADVRSKVTIGRKLKVAVDPGNGTACLYATDLIKGLWGQDVAGINMELDGNFPVHSPNPQKEGNLAGLIQLVKDENADIGLIFDGDADRVMAVDEKGNVIQPDRMLALLAKDALSRHSGASIIGDVTCSQAVFDVIEANGGNGILWMTGHSLIKEKLHETQAIIAGEISGHIFFAEDYYGFDDAYLAAGKLLQIFSQSDEPLSALNDAIPHYFSTKVYRPHCDMNIVPDVMEALKNEFQDKATIVELDGVRANFSDGWFIVRASNTEPVLSIRIEGKTKAQAQSYKDSLVESLSKFEAIDLADLQESL